MARPASTSHDTIGPDRSRAAPVHRLAARVEDFRRSAQPTLLGYALTVYAGWRTVLVVTLLALALGEAYLFVATPRYEATSLVQIEQRKRTLAGLEEFSSALAEDPTDADVEILRSRTLLGLVVDQLDLTVDALPRYVPIVGRAIARVHKAPGLASPPHENLSRFAWGGERIEIDRLKVADELLDKPMILTALDGGRFDLALADGGRLLEGSRGAPASSTGADGKPQVELLVSQLVARPGTEFMLTKRNREHVIDGLQAELRVQPRGRRTGIVVIDFEATDPVRVSAIVNGVANTYLRQNVERKSAEASKTLEFIESQLPSLKTQLETAEKALNNFRLTSNSPVDASSEARNMLERERDIDRQISEVELKRSQLRQSFTENHPNLASIANQLAQLKAEKMAIANRMRALPQAEVSSARLSREVQDRTNLYIGLANRAQELRVVKSGTIGDVRIIDPAHVPDRPSRPRSGAVVVLTTLLGLVGGALVSIAKRSLASCAESADDIEAATELPVYVTVPHSQKQASISRKRGRSGAALLSIVEPGDIAIETMRSLRTSVQFALVEARNNVVALTGPAPGVGKSFVSLNLAHVLAAAGRKVLLVDCDLRRGRLHRTFGRSRKPGLSDVVSGEAPLDAAIHQVPGTSLHVLGTGEIPPNPAELLSSKRFESLILDVSASFELVIVDTPPVLVVSDAMLVARLAGVNLMVFRAGMHTRREISLAVKQFTLNGTPLHGSVLNDVRPMRGGRYGRDGYIRYDYQSDPSD
jgi:tyrosine-protein kinase Etk/Wzc